MRACRCTGMRGRCLFRRRSNRIKPTACAESFCKPEMTGEYSTGLCKRESIANHSLFLGQTVNGHEFHYSRLDPASDAGLHYSCPGKRYRCGKDGLIAGNALGCYTHTYFTPLFADALVPRFNFFTQIISVLYPSREKFSFLKFSGNKF